MKVIYLPNRFERKENIPHYKIYSEKYATYYAAFTSDDNAYLNVFNSSFYSTENSDFEPSSNQKRIVIEQIFFKLKLLMED